MENARPPAVGERIRTFRKERGYTLELLAEKSGVSKAMLSQIESDKVNPTVATVWKIARGLGVELERVLGAGDRPVRRFDVTHRDDVAELDTEENGPHIRVLTPIEMAEDLEIYDLTFPVGSVLDSKPHEARSEEYLTVFGGEIRVEVVDRRTHLHEGDFIAYNCDVRHLIRNTGDTPARVHLVVRFSRQAFG